MTQPLKLGYLHSSKACKKRSRSQRMVSNDGVLVFFVFLYSSVASNTKMMRSSRVALINLSPDRLAKRAKTTPNQASASGLTASKKKIMCGLGTQPYTGVSKIPR